MNKINPALERIVDMAQNGSVQGGKLITEEELEQLKSQIINGALPVWRQEAGTSLTALRDEVARMPLLAQERQETLKTIDALEQVGHEHASSTNMGARFLALWHKVADKASQALDTITNVGSAIGERIGGPTKLTGKELSEAKRSEDSGKQAQALHRLISPFANQRLGADARIAQMNQLLEGMSGAQLAEVRAAYIKQFDADPYIHITGGSFGQPLLASRTQGSLNLPHLARNFLKNPKAGFQNVESWAVKTYQDIVQDPKTGPTDGVKAMAQAWLTPELREVAQNLARLADKVKAGEPLTADERRAYFAQMPFVGIRTRSERPHNEPTLEEQTLQKLWSQMGREDLAKTMETVEASFPKITPPGPKPGQKSVAVVVSSQGAQWQELMGYVMEMQRHGVHVQFFTPEGRPAGFQKDSLSRSNTSNLGYGAPPELDPAGPTGMVAKELLANSMAASEFDPKAFDQVYVAGGLGLNEDGVRVEAALGNADHRGKQTGPASTYHAHPDIARMINSAATEQTPILAICHGPSIFIADNVQLNVQGAHMAALGPFEAYVAWTGRTGRPFPHMALVHNDARRAGVNVNPVRDAIKPSGVVQDVVKQGDQEVTIVTGPHPASAKGLGQAGLELMGIQADKARYLYRRER